MATNGDEINEPEQQRKLYIGGMSCYTTDESLREYFSQWGETDYCIVMKDLQTKRSRGFGFVVFKKICMVDAAMEKRPHTIDGKAVILRRAVSREDLEKPGALATVEKIFVGGIQDDMCEEDLRSYFTKFGPVEIVEMIMDRKSGKKREFAFVTFADHGTVDKVLRQEYHTLNGHNCGVKIALPKTKLENAKAKQRSRSANDGDRGDYPPPVDSSDLRPRYSYRCPECVRRHNPGNRNSAILRHGGLLDSCESRDPYARTALTGNRSSASPFPPADKRPNTEPPSSSSPYDYTAYLQSSVSYGPAKWSTSSYRSSGPYESGCKSSSTPANGSSAYSSSSAPPSR